MIRRFDLLCDGEKIGETVYFVISHTVMRESVIDSDTHNLKLPLSETCPCCGQNIPEDCPLEDAE